MTNKLTDKVILRHGATLNNRIAMLPMQSQSGKRNGFVSDDTLKTVFVIMDIKRAT